MKTRILLLVHIFIFLSAAQAANQNDVTKFWLERTAKQIVLNMKFEELISKRTRQSLLKQYVEYSTENHRKALKLLIVWAEKSNIKLHDRVEEEVSDKEWLNEVIALNQPTSVKLAFRNILSNNKQLAESMDWAINSSNLSSVKGYAEKVRPMFVANFLVGRKLDHLVAQPDSAGPLQGSE